MEIYTKPTMIESDEKKKNVREACRCSGTSTHAPGNENGV